ncbi:hypothetical protein Fmac_031818 [Flemingia macrophylla]|uniref:Uncharacterized protein n=1 Tax=Flemingia macrophylla TaxID=520843 RepID=A0ABD1L355_9FABA
MESKTICFCIRRLNSKSKEKKVEDLKKLPHRCHKGKTKESASTAPVGDGGGINVDGGSTIGSNDAGVTAAVVAAAHVSLMSVTAWEGQDGSSHDHGGESGADGGG